MNITRVGVDIAKSVFHVHCVDRHGRPQWCAKLKRNQWLDALCDRVAPGAEIGMEACASAHFWGRQLQQRGYPVKLIAAQFVKPYVKSNKNDRVDAEAEAVGFRGLQPDPQGRTVRLIAVAQRDARWIERILESSDGVAGYRSHDVGG